MKVQPLILITTFPFNRNSAGIVAQHKLCHILQGFGFNAQLVFIKGEAITNPLWNTPVWQGSQENQISVAIYSEIIRGNPLNATHCLYWILGDFIEAPQGDSLRWHGVGEELLRINLIDPQIFHSAIPKEDFYLIYRAKNRNWLPSLPNGARSVIVDRFGKNTVSSEKFLELLAKAKCLVIGEDSLVIEEAIFSGTPVIATSAAVLPEYASKIPCIYRQSGEKDWPQVEELQAAIDISREYLQNKYNGMEESVQNLLCAISSLTESTIPTAPPRKDFPKEALRAIARLRITSALKKQGVKGALAIIKESVTHRIRA